MNETGNEGVIRSMAQKRKGPRLYLRRRNGGGLWVIRHGGLMVATGCAEDNLEGAEECLKVYADACGEFPGNHGVQQPIQRDGRVYFASCNHPNFPIKIGWATDVKYRLQALQCALPYEITLLAAFQGTLEDERRLHIGFHEHRLEGEWFERAPALLILIDRYALLSSHLAHNERSVLHDMALRQTAGTH